MAYPFPPFCGIPSCDETDEGVCQKQITVPNNSLLYCSEKCRREDAQHSSASSLSRSYSSGTLEPRSSGPMKITPLEPSRRDQWGVPPSPTYEPLASSPQLRPNSRPLPPLHPRSLGSSPRSMDLVMPVYRENETPEKKSLDYARRTVEGNTVSQGGLKKLFNFKEMQGSQS